MSVDALVDDLWCIICQHLTDIDLLRIASSSCRYRSTIFLRAGQARFPWLTATKSTVSAACQIRHRVPHKTQRNMLLPLLNADVRMFARRLDENKTKVDGEFAFYSIRVLNYRTGAYRYSDARVTGEQTLEDLRLDRVFVVADNVKIHDDDDDFDDDGATHRLSRLRHHFTKEEDRLLVPSMRAVFGFKDAGNVIARSAQCVTINPRLQTCPWWATIEDVSDANDESHDADETDSGVES